MCTHKLFSALVSTILTFASIAVLAQGPNLGKPVSPDEVAAWDISILPDGTGLPPGNGTPVEGSQIYAQKCALCHGENGKGGTNAALVGGLPVTGGIDTRKTIANFWPHATTLFDVIRRAMPWQQPRTLTDAEGVRSHRLHPRAQQDHRRERRNERRYVAQGTHAEPRRVHRSVSGQDAVIGTLLPRRRRCYRRPLDDSGDDPERGQGAVRLRAWRSHADSVGTIAMQERSIIERVDILEQNVETLESLPARVTAVELQLVQLRDEMRGEFSATRAELRAEIHTGDEQTRREMHALHEQALALIEETRVLVRAGDEQTRGEMYALHEQTLVLMKEGDGETRRYMRVLHEEVISRLAILGEGCRRPRKPS